MRPILLEGGTIRTLDPAAPVTDQLAIADGRVVAEPAPGSRRIDLEGRCVLPGFNDAHVHFPTWALAQRQVRLQGAATIGGALSVVGAAARSCEAGTWLRGLGWRSNDWTPAVEPTRQLLDAVTGDVPTALMA